MGDEGIVAVATGTKPTTMHYCYRNGQRTILPRGDIVLTLIDESLESFLRATVPLSAVDIDVSFVPPDDEWGAKLTRPTVSVHLWDVRRSIQRAITGIETFERDGVTMRRMALPRAELHYVITAWASDPSDERALLGAVLVALLGHNEIPMSFTPDVLHDLPLPVLTVAREGDNNVKLIKDAMKLGLQLTVTAVVDIGAAVSVAAAPSAIDIGFTDMQSGARSVPPRRIAGEVRSSGYTGAVVTSPRGSATVDETGRFLIKALPGDEIVVVGPETLSVIAPVEGGVTMGQP